MSDFGLDPVALLSEQLARLHISPVNEVADWEAQLEVMRVEAARRGAEAAHAAQREAQEREARRQAQEAYRQRAAALAGVVSAQLRAKRQRRILQQLSHGPLTRDLVIEQRGSSTEVSCTVPRAVAVALIGRGGANAKMLRAAVPGVRLQIEGARDADNQRLVVSGGYGIDVQRMLLVVASDAARVEEDLRLYEAEKDARRAEVEARRAEAEARRIVAQREAQEREARRSGSGLQHEAAAQGRREAEGEATLKDSVTTFVRAKVRRQLMEQLSRGVLSQAYTPPHIEQRGEIVEVSCYMPTAFAGALIGHGGATARRLRNAATGVSLNILGKKRDAEQKLVLLGRVADVSLMIELVNEELDLLDVLTDRAARARTWHQLEVIKHTEESAVHELQAAALREALEVVQGAPRQVSPSTTRPLRTPAGS